MRFSTPPPERGFANLLLLGGYGDVALRDFGLLLAALALARLAPAYSPR